MDEQHVVELLDLGDIERVVCRTEGCIGDCEIEVYGTKGTRRYNTGKLLTQHHFRQGHGILWHIQLEQLLEKWHNDAKKGYHTWYHAGDEIELLPMYEVMRWARENASVYSQMPFAHPLDLLQGDKVRWIDCHGWSVSEPEWFRPMYALWLIYATLKTSRERERTISPREMDDLIHDEYVMLKIILDAHAGTMLSEPMRAGLFKKLAEVREKINAIVRAVNEMVVKGEFPENGLAMYDCGPILEYLADKVQFDYVQAMMKCAQQCQQTLRDKRLETIREVPAYTPFRYPCTRMAYDMW